MEQLPGEGAAAEEHVRLILREYERRPLHGAFAVQLVQRLRDAGRQGDARAVVARGALSLQGATTNQMVQGDHQQQAETNVTVRNIITSMRLIAEVDWAEVFESVSLVDDALRRGSNFADLDFPTRNSYRSSIEELARGSKLTELEIARAALAACGRPTRDRGICTMRARRSRIPPYRGRPPRVRESDRVSPASRKPAPPSQ